jgi:hypothetical protein
MAWVWAGVGLALLVLLVVSWRMDRAVRRRGSRVLHSADVWYEVREGRRDAGVVSPFAKDSRDYSWTSWTRRNRS